MHKYRPLGKKGEGTFSEVLKAQDTKTNRYVAIKCMKNHFENVDQVNRLREIQALRRLSPHPNIIKLYEVLYDRTTGRLALVFELMDFNIYEMIRGRRQYIAEEKVLHYMYQLMKSVDHMHRNGIFHRDIKPENILICGDALKLADFGSCRGIYSKQPFTEYISTRWYRAPECLLTDGYYNYKMDMWGIGCVFFEILALYPLFPGSNEIDQINKIHNVVGTPHVELLAKFQRQSTHLEYDFPTKVGIGITKLLPHVSMHALDLMLKLLTYNPEERISAKEALRHPYFREIRELDKKLRKQRLLDRNSYTLTGGSSATEHRSPDAATSGGYNEDDSNASTLHGSSSVNVAASTTRLPTLLPSVHHGTTTSKGSQNVLPVHSSFSLTSTITHANTNAPPKKMRSMADVSGAAPDSVGTTGYHAGAAAVTKHPNITNAKLPAQGASVYSIGIGRRDESGTGYTPHHTGNGGGKLVPLKK